MLCGLGWNPTTEAPVLPEHDIELAFDVQFNVEDVVEVSRACSLGCQCFCDVCLGAVHTHTPGL